MYLIRKIKNNYLLKYIAHFFIRRAENRIGAHLDYVHHIADADVGLLFLYNKIFSFLNPNRKVPALAYHTARLRGAIAADCGTCVEAEINLARNSGIDHAFIDHIVSGDLKALPPEISAVVSLSDAVTGQKSDDAEAREIIRNAFGEAGLIEISLAMNGAALPPGIKRALGFATSCDIELIRKFAKQGNV